MYIRYSEEGSREKWLQRGIICSKQVLFLEKTVIAHRSDDNILSSDGHLSLPELESLIDPKRETISAYSYKL